MLTKILLILANLEIVWLYRALSGPLDRYHQTTGLTMLAGWQIGIAFVVALSGSLLPRRMIRIDGERLALLATGFAIIGLCAALVGAMPVPIGNVVR